MAVKLVADRPSQILLRFRFIPDFVLREGALGSNSVCSVQLWGPRVYGPFVRLHRGEKPQRPLINNFLSTKNLGLTPCWLFPPHQASIVADPRNPITDRVSFHVGSHQLISWPCRSLWQRFTSPNHWQKLYMFLIQHITE